jgi:hypothetical protein
MEDVNYDYLLNIVKKNTKSHFVYNKEKDTNGKTIILLGAKSGDIAKLERNGEFYGIAVEILDPIKPLLTDVVITKVLKMLKKENYATVLEILHITSLEEIWYILHKWFTVAVNDYNFMLKKIVKKTFPDYDKWIETERTTPLHSRLIVRDIGYNSKTGHSVFPPEWIGKEFSNGTSLHSAMNKLESRIGKPPVTYAVIHTMHIQTSQQLITDITNNDYKYLFVIRIKKGVFSTTLQKPEDGLNYVIYDKIIIGFKLTELFEDKNNSNNNREVSVLVSRLQKAIRRGKYASNILMETIDKLNESANYNLPEHGFMRVSASKQLIWRLFISTIEDCRPYKKDSNQIDLLDMICLTLITQKYTEYKFNKTLLKIIKNTALCICSSDTKNDIYDWRKLENATKTTITKSDFHNSLHLALTYLPMMEGDRNMLSKYYSFKNDLKKLASNSEVLNKKSVYENVLYSSFDHHCKPTIILYYQACIKAGLMDTKLISRYIWDISSAYNVRTKSEYVVDNDLIEIQKFFCNYKQNSYSFEKIKISTNGKENIPYHISRTVFILLFGHKYKYSGKEVIICGDDVNYLKIKISNKWTETSNEKALNAFPSKTINLTKLDPPIGYKWKYDTVKIYIKNSIPYINDKPVKFFDGSMCISSVSYSSNAYISKSIHKKIMAIMSADYIPFSDILFFRNNSVCEYVKWVRPNKDGMYMNKELLYVTYMKLFNQYNNIVMVGPVDRSGSKMQNSINYKLEGKVWALLNLFCYLYPDSIKPHGLLNFVLDRKTAGYHLLISDLKRIIFKPTIKQNMFVSKPIIKTKLWNHQIETAEKVVNDFNMGIRGRGNASDVGSGKTLTSLEIARQLMITNKNDSIYYGVLVLLPGNPLIKTWKDEIEKHTKGFDVIFQGTGSKQKIQVKSNTIVVTTMARNRENPVRHKWLLVIIDECLTVQNKDALWTEEAWKQCLLSKHLIMMSATFFRSRHDKLYYMLKMLGSGLPETREYLDTILVESIISNISNIKKEWIVNIHKFNLDKKSRKNYDMINDMELSVEKKYAKLSGLLVNDIEIANNFVLDLKKLIKNLELKKRKCLIYARSKAEAELWSDNLGIPIYPEKSNHCIVTYHAGTYGLNDLIIYNTIIMRPPTPDTLPQIKGRLDRPGNKYDKLYIEYVLIENTIDEGLLIRMEIALQFTKKYIMPLAQFYDISVNGK